MNRYFSLTLLTFCFVLNQSFAQIKKTDILIGQSFIIPSKILKEDITVQVSSPTDYGKSDNQYPVVYILDGQWFFSHALSVRSDFTERNGSKVVPDFIIVAVITNNDKRGDWAIDKASKFMAFLEKETIPFIDKTFKSNRERLLFGWEATGGFVIKVMSQKPDLFEGFLAASPTPLYGAYFPGFKKEHQQLDSLLTNNKELDKFLYVGESETDYPAQYGIEVLTNLLKEKAPSKLRWEHKRMKEVSHPMTAYGTLKQGLKAYYKYYNSLEFTSMEEFNKLGGIDYLEKFYEERARKSAIKDDEKAKHATRRNLTLTAISEDNYAMFDFLFEKFKADSLLEESFPAHINAYAQFYLKNNKTDKALEIVNFLIKKDTESAMAFNSLGDIYNVLGKKEEARKNYVKAVEIGKKNDDWRLDEYMKDLESF